jgi:hypothetical protein
MLPKDKGGVVDHNLKVNCFSRRSSSDVSDIVKVYGTANLRVVDLSVVPLHVCTHTQCKFSPQLLHQGAKNAIFSAIVYGIAEQGSYSIVIDMIDYHGDRPNFFSSCRYYQGSILCLSGL